MHRRRRSTILKASLAGAIAVSVLLAAWWWLRPGGAAVTPGRDIYPVRGIDISAHNGSADFGALAADSIDFVVIKASEGGSFKDAMFHENYRGARQAGLMVGAYHFFRFDVPGYLQALNFLHSLRGKPLDLPAVIDIEEWTNPTNHTASAVVKQLSDLITTLEEAGYPVMLYTNKDGYTRYIRGYLDSYPLWIASLTAAPDADGWRMWQYTHRGRVAGIGGNVDINTFNGSREDWENWLSEMSVQRQ